MTTTQRTKAVSRSAKSRAVGRALKQTASCQYRITAGQRRAIVEKVKPRKRSA